MEASAHANEIPDPGEFALVCENISKQFVVAHRTIPALRNINLKITRGHVTGLIGPDGAGKTTLMRLAVGLLEPDQGRIRVQGVDATRNSLQVQASTGYMPQRFGLYEDLSVQENLELYADLQGVPQKQRGERYRELMRMTGLAPFLTRLAGRLSGGMKQKLGLACTLVRPPALLLLDEPTVGVDPVSRRELWQIVYRLVKSEGMTVLLSTAYLDEAERCHEVILLHEGELMGQGPPGEFSDRLEGRTYAVTGSPGKKRSIQESLSHAHGVLDAVIQGESVRLVMEDAKQPDFDSLLRKFEGTSWKTVPPRLEDGFIAMLQKRRDETVRSRIDAEPVRQFAGSKKEEQHVIEAIDVRRRFGDFYAVRGVSFRVNQGEVFGLLGANGAGKSTTFRMLCGLLPATSGRVSVAGLDLRRAAAAARGRIGYMSQKFSQYGSLSVVENLRFFSSAYGLFGRRREQRIRWALEQFDLAPLKDTNSIDLSLGYKQRLAMACALMHEPAILFLDEPTSGVDPLARREFWSRINALAERHVTVLVTTHFMEEAEYCDRLAIMAEGEILALGTPEEIRRRVRTEEFQHPTMEDAFIRLIERQDKPTDAPE